VRHLQTAFFQGRTAKIYLPCPWRAHSDRRQHRKPAGTGILFMPRCGVPEQIRAIQGLAEEM